MDSADLKHKLVAEVKQIAIDLGHAPSRREYRQHSKYGERAYTRIFGGYTLLLQAAGLKKFAEKIDPQAAFRAEMPATPAPSEGGLHPKTRSYDPKTGVCNRILVLGDLHFPWASVDALTAVYAFIEAHPEIDMVVQVGDLYDMYSWAKFPRSHLLYNPREEIERGREMAEEMWSKIRKMLPRARMVQLLGNHDIRPMKKVLELAPELELFLSFKKYFEFPDVELVEDPREPFEVNGIFFMHGFLSGLGTHARKYGRSIVCGHTHKGGVVSIPLAGPNQYGTTVLFECNAGYLGDPTSRPMSYTPSRMNEWTLGFAYIDEWGPRFISL